MVSRLASLPLAPLCGLPMPCSERTPAAGRPAAARGATLHFHDVDMTLLCRAHRPRPPGDWQAAVQGAFVYREY